MMFVLDHLRIFCRTAVGVVLTCYNGQTQAGGVSPPEVGSVEDRRFYGRKVAMRGVVGDCVGWVR